MMRDELLERLEQWHEEDEYEQIVQAIEEIPAEERDYDLISQLGRALNNLERYEEAVEQFLTVAEEGKDDPLWHYRLGLAYYYLEQYEEARQAFEAADRLEPGDEDTLEFLEWIRSKTAQETEEEPVSEESAEDKSAAPLVSDAVIGTDFDIASFWDDSEFALATYVSEPPTDELIESVEEELVFRLPVFYKNMMKVHNGGIPRNRFFPAEGSYIEISGIPGIGREKSHSLCGNAGSRAVIEKEGYPEFGVIIAECPPGSGVVMLDYRPSLNDGEPEVVHVDKENNNKVTPLAPDFETFVRGLVSEKR